MTDREKVCYLKRYPNAMRQVDRKLDALDRLRSMQGKVTRPYAPKVTGGSHFYNREEDLIIKIVDLRDEVLEDMGEAANLLRENLGIIKTMDDHRLQLLMELRYVSGQTWIQIASDFELCQKTIFDLHSKALRQVVIP